MRPLLFAAIALASVCAAESLGAKGQTVKLMVSGGGLRQSIEISGKDVWFANPWDGAFVRAWKSVPPPAGSPRYDVSFYEELRPRDVRMMYVVEYARSADGRGAIHLPGHGDSRYRQNISTIMRDGQDGQWFPASDEWERVVGSRLR